MGIVELLTNSFAELEQHRLVVKYIIIHPYDAIFIKYSSTLYQDLQGFEGSFWNANIIIADSQKKGFITLVADRGRSNMVDITKCEGYPACDEEIELEPIEHINRLELVE